MQCEFKGVISALPTPYDQSQQIDMESLRKLIRFNIEQNIKGLYVGGSTGEAFLQNVAEREKILETVADESDGRLTLIAHVGGISTAEKKLQKNTDIMLYLLLLHFIILFHLKSIVSITGRLLILQMDFRW